MAQQEKVSVKLDLKRSASVSRWPTAVKTANYTVLNPDDDGRWFFANRTETTMFTLPPVNAVNGTAWHFAQLNTGKLEIVGDTNAIHSPLSVNATHGLKRITTGANLGVVVTLLGDGTWYHAFSNVTSANVGAFTQA